MMTNMKEGAYNPFVEAQAPLPSTSAEKRLEGLLDALVSLCEEWREDPYLFSVRDIEKIIKEYEKD